MLCYIHMMICVILYALSRVADIVICEIQNAYSCCNTNKTFTIIKDRISVTHRCGWTHQSHAIAGRPSVPARSGPPRRASAEQTAQSSAECSVCRWTGGTRN